MPTIVGISGSLRRGSYNAALLRAAAASMPEGSQLQIESINDVPLYNGDDERESGIPPAVTRIKSAVAAADGFLIVTPEYNNGIPGVTKNVIDWMSRPPADVPRVFNAKPVAIAGASPSGFGTILAQNAWLPVMRTLGCELWSGRLLISRVAGFVDASGEINDPTTLDNIRKFMAGFVAHLAARATRNPP